MIYDYLKLLFLQMEAAQTNGLVIEGEKASSKPSWEPARGSSLCAQ